MRDSCGVALGAASLFSHRRGFWIVLSFVLLSFWHDALGVLAAGGKRYTCVPLPRSIARTDAAAMAASLAIGLLRRVFRGRATRTPLRMSGPGPLVHGFHCDVRGQPS